MPYFVVPGLATLVVGFLLFGIAILRSGVLPRWRAILLVIGALAMTGANEQTVTALLFIPFGIAWIAVGHAIWSAANNEPQISGGEADRSVIQPEAVAGPPYIDDAARPLFASKCGSDAIAD